MLQRQLATDMIFTLRFLIVGQRVFILICSITAIVHIWTFKSINHFSLARLLSSFFYPLLILIICSAIKNSSWHIKILYLITHLSTDYIHLDIYSAISKCVQTYANSYAIVSAQKKITVNNDTRQGALQ